jgi:hypothetical protein
MAQSHIEFLFQITAPARDRGGNAARSEAGLTGFGDHLAALGPPEVQAAATSRSSANSLPYDREYAAQLEERRSSPGADQSPPATADATSSPSESCDHCDEAPVEGAVTSTAGEAVSDPAAPNDEASAKLDAQNADSDGQDADAQSSDDDINAVAAAVVGTADNGAALLAVEATEATVAAAETSNNMENPSAQAATSDLTDRNRPQAGSNSETAAAIQEISAQVSAVSADGETNADFASDRKADNTSVRTGRNKKAAREAQNAIAGEGSSDRAGKLQPAAQQNQRSDAQIVADGQSSPDRPRRTRSRASSDSATTDGGTTATANKAIIAAVNALQNVAGSDPGRSDTDGETGAKVSKPNAVAKGEALAAGAGKALSSHASARRGTGAAESTDLPRVDAARFVGRVAKAVKTAHERGGTLQLRLSPPELCSVRL